MNQKRTAATRIGIRVAIGIRGAMAASLAFAFLPAIMMAHGGEEHVTGTVAKVSDSAVSVKTTAGKSVEVGFDAKITFTRVKQPIAKTDIKVGDRVVIHAKEVNEKLIANTVEIGAAPAGKAPAKSATKP
jgi:hypothetical protein